jgi:hypothetical protein
MEAIELLISYITTPSDLDRSQQPFPISPFLLVARISDSNTPSVRLFEKLGFKIVKHVQVFGEVEMRLEDGISVERTWRRGRRIAWPSTNAS